MEIGFIEVMREIEDYRIKGMIKYPLDEIFLTTLVGILCGADDWDEIEFLGTEYQDWLQRFLPYANGIPTAQTFRKVFRLICPKALEQCFVVWVETLGERVRGVVAIDGKTLRGSKACADGSGALHMLSAYACESGLVIGQRSTSGKGHEIKAIPELLAMLELEGCIVTIDAIGTQTAITDRIIRKKADYILALKGNQGSLHDDVREYFEDDVLTSTCVTGQTSEQGHGRTEERSILVTDDIKWLKKRHPAWSGLCSIAAVTSTRTTKTTGKTSTETRFYISSLSADPNLLLSTIRSHWAIENSLHWQLDVTFHEDFCRTRKDHSPKNFAIFRHAALNLLKRDPSKISIAKKRLKACTNQNFRLSLLTI